GIDDCQPWDSERGGYDRCAIDYRSRDHHRRLQFVFSVLDSEGLHRIGNNFPEASESVLANFLHTGRFGPND
ncbi:MAG TPA: hypothetical protein VGI80_01140, partial [Pyrinomonadaceae bacterium]